MIIDYHLTYIPFTVIKLLVVREILETNSLVIFNILVNDLKSVEKLLYLGIKTPSFRTPPKSVPVYNLYTEACTLKPQYLDNLPKSSSFGCLSQHIVNLNFIIFLCSLLLSDVTVTAVSEKPLLRDSCVNPFLRHEEWSLKACSILYDKQTCQQKNLI